MSDELSDRSIPQASVTGSGAVRHERRTRPLFGVMLALAAVAIWGSTAVIARHLALQDVSMSVVAFLRVLIGGSVLAVWLATTTSDSFRRCVTLLRSRWIWFGLLSYGANMLFFHWALDRTTASAVIMLENMAPVVALFGGMLLFHERITMSAVVALALATGGVWFVCSGTTGSGAEGGGEVAVGNALAVLAGITWAGYTLACHGDGLRGTGGDGLSTMTVMLLGSTVMLLVLLPGSHGWPVTTQAWAWVIVLAVLHTAVSTVLWRRALEHISAYVASLLFLVTIVLTVLNEAVFLEERVTPRMIVGAVAIVAALLTLAVRRNDSEQG